MLMKRKFLFLAFWVFSWFLICLIFVFINFDVLQFAMYFFHWFTLCGLGFQVNLFRALFGWVSGCTKSRDWFLGLFSSRKPFPLLALQDDQSPYEQSVVFPHGWINFPSYFIESLKIGLGWLIVILHQVRRLKVWRSWC